MIKFSMDPERGNEMAGKPDFGQRMQELMKELKVEAAYFTVVNGTRGGYFVVNMEENSEMPGVGEPLFSWLHAKLEVFPVMRPEDLQKAQPTIQAALAKWR